MGLKDELKDLEDSASKKLPRWMQPVSCGHWLYFQMRAGEKQCCSGICIGTGAF